MIDQQFMVTGMTCENCRRHVTEALAGLPGVRSVDVDLPSGRATVHAEHAVNENDVRAALEDAGYDLA
jgi:copper chaperone